MSRRRECVNCGGWTRWPLCRDCVRMVVLTVISELIVAGILWLVRG